jgi:diguanylate cyclase (GGDEF)-like protein
MSDDLDWSEDDLEATKVADAAELGADLARESVRDRAYLILLTGNDVGKIFKLAPGEVQIGRSHRAEIRIEDDSISRAHCKITLDNKAVQVEDLGSSNGTFVNGKRVERAALRDGDKIRVGEVTILKFTFHDRLDESFQRHMYNAALRDGLTKAYNKRHFVDQLIKEVRFCQRHGTPLSMLMMDLDHFKRVNDTHGHIAGDDVLVQFATMAQGMLRAEDVFARYGGEEFAIITRGIVLEHAGMLADRLRQTIEAMTFVSGELKLKVTVSIGVAGWHPDMDGPERLVEAADAALYEAKRTGRNRVVLKYPPR